MAKKTQAQPPAQSGDRVQPLPQRGSLFKQILDSVAGVHALLRGTAGFLLLSSAVVLSWVFLHFVVRLGGRLIDWIDRAFK